MMDIRAKLSEWKGMLLSGIAKGMTSDPESVKRDLEEWKKRKEEEKNEKKGDMDTDKG
jgi:hypothetical protein